MLNPNLADLNGHGVAEPPALLESALDVLVDHTFATSLTCLIFLCVALELVRYWRAEEEKQRKREAAERHERHERVMLLGVDDELPRHKHDGEARSVCFSFLLKGACCTRSCSSSTCRWTRASGSGSGRAVAPPRKNSMGDRDSSRRMSGSDGMGDKRGSDPLSALGRSLKNVMNKDRRKSQ